MNLFFLDEDLDKCAEYHVDKHIGKMQLEAAQILSTTLWIDKLFGFIPRKLTCEEIKELKYAISLEPSINNRSFTRYLPTHVSHPCAIWARSSLEHHYWLICYINALDSENIYRGNKPHASCKEANRLPDPINLENIGWTEPPQCMPDQYKINSTVMAYRTYYLREKAHLASWKVRGAPPWWNPRV